MDINKFYDYSDCIEIDRSCTYDIQGQKYYRIKCIKEFKDGNAKRTIKVGELGGYLHTTTNEVKHWIEEYQVVGQEITVTAKIQFESKQQIMHSNIQNFKEPIAEIYKFWMLKCGATEPSLYNAYVSHSKRIWEFADEMYAIEERYITQPNNANESQRILLWVALGAILEAILKLHIVSLRIHYDSFIKSKKRIEKIKVADILSLLKTENIIENNEFLILSKINGNRNMIHFLNNEQIYSYDTYVQYVDILSNVLEKLFQIQKKHYDPNIKNISE